MKPLLSISLCVIILFNTLSISAQAPQEKGHVSRIKVYGTKADLLKIRKSGIELDHGIFDSEAGTYINDVDYSEVIKIRDLGYRIDILVDNVFEYTDSLNRVQDPYMLDKAPVKVDPQFESLKVNFTTSCQGYNAYITTPPSFSLGSRGGFYNLSELEAEIDEMVAAHPTLVSKSSIGNTLQGRPIWVVKISDNVSLDESEPEALYTGMHHAREGMSMMNLIFFMRFLIDNYSSNAHVADIVNNRELFFIPVANIDGFNYNTTLTNWNALRRMRRKNMRSVPIGYDPNAAIPGANGDGSGGPGVDMNRNYGTYWGAGFSNGNTASSNTTTSDAYRGSAAFSEPETVNMRNYVNSRNFKMALNYHCYGNWWIRPEGPDPSLYPTTALPAANVTTYNSLAALFSKYNCFVYGTALQTVYDVNGYSDDWMFADPSHSPVYSFSPEIGSAGDGFWCPQAQIIPYAKELIFPNLQAAYTAGSYAEVQDNSDVSIAATTGSFSYTVTRKGLTDGPITVSIIPLTNIQSVGAPVTIGSIAAFAGTSTGSINYTLSSSIPAGSIVRYILQLQTGGITTEETIYKIYSPTIVFEDNMDTPADITKWTRSGTGADWAYLAAGGVGGTSSLTESPAGNYDDGASNHIMRITSALNLASSTRAFLSFMIRYNSENCMDRLHVEISTTGPTGTYLPICTSNTVSENKGSLGGVAALTGLSDGWIRQVVDLTSYTGNNNIGLRFRFNSNGSNEQAYASLRDGFNLDNLKVVKTNLITLPVTFQDISVIRQGDKVLVTWKAQFDANFSHYEIQRSANGVDFISIGMVDLNSATSFLDQKPLKGHNYYRIKAADIDNSYRLSKTVAVVFESSSMFSVYPNPASDLINIEIVSASAGKMIAEIINISGQVVYKKDIVIKQGYNTQQVNTDKWTRQFYIVKLRDEFGNVLKTLKVLKK